MSEWRPLGVRGTLRFLFSRGNAIASWRHFGWQLEIERGSGYLSVLFERRMRDA